MRSIDVAVVGGGHNGLVAAAYLAKAGLRVQVLERLDVVGGAAVSAHAFDGVDARLSRYAYLVSLLPARILDDLGAAVQLARRRYSSYTPDPSDGGRTGLLVGERSSFAAIGAPGDETGFADFYRRCRSVTEPLWPTLLEPLRTRAQARRHVLAAGGPDAAAAWSAIVDQPIGAAITEAVSSDLVRGVVATDALIGTFARLDDPELHQNVCVERIVVARGEPAQHAGPPGVCGWADILHGKQAGPYGAHREGLRDPLLVVLVVQHVATRALGVPELRVGVRRQ